ncbi:MAG: FeoB-associated Cys-rich membrane protein [Desulfobacteraceae bacterium]|nr:FeoB-associated Cys-rich membrane protein [Desulfobacteraceae bacterium]
MWQNMIIVAVVLLCALYLGRKFLRQARGKTGGGCRCNGCSGPPAGTPEGRSSDQKCGCGERR